jgi:hypothetical protein
MATHVVIIGGISVNDPGRHDRFPYNFINPGIKRAIAYRQAKKPVSVIVVAPPYRIRVRDQRVEHKVVEMTWLDSCRVDRHVPPPCPQGSKVHKIKNPDHMLNVLRASARKHRFALIEIDRRAQLTGTLNSFGKIESVDYFGHSDKTRLFLIYSTTVAGAAEETWAADEAAKVPASKFTPTATFTSFGCNQGDAGGLASKLRELWGIRTVGSEGKTDYGPIGQGKAFPSSADGYFEYAKPRTTDGRRVLPARERIPSSRL